MVVATNGGECHQRTVRERGGGKLQDTQTHTHAHKMSNDTVKYLERAACVCLMLRLSLPAGTETFYTERWTMWFLKRLYMAACAESGVYMNRFSSGVCVCV